jgi:hypothetical protein
MLGRCVCDKRGVTGGQVKVLGVRDFNYHDTLEREVRLIGQLGVLASQEGVGYVAPQHFGARLVEYWHAAA